MKLLSGAISINLPGQAEKLIEALKKKDDFKDSWKLLTIWIGGNDLCALCKNDKHTLEKYVGGIRDALDMFHAEVSGIVTETVSVVESQVYIWGGARSKARSRKGIGGFTSLKNDKTKETIEK